MNRPAGAIGFGAVWFGEWSVFCAANRYLLNGVGSLRLPSARKRQKARESVGLEYQRDDPFLCLRAIVAHRSKKDLGAIDQNGRFADDEAAFRVPDGSIRAFHHN